MTDFSGLTPALVLAALYNAASPLGMGFMAYDPTPMGEVDAQALLDQRSASPDFDYLNGRPLKLSFTQRDAIDLRWYDRDQGEGFGASVIAKLRETGDPAAPGILAMSKAGTQANARKAVEAGEEGFSGLTDVRGDGRVQVFTLDGLHPDARDAAARVLEGG